MTCHDAHIAFLMTFLLYILVFCTTMVFFLVALFDERHAVALTGAGFGVLMLLACRGSYTGLICHLYTNSEPFLAAMRPSPQPDPPGCIDNLFTAPSAVMVELTLQGQAEQGQGQEQAQAQA